MQDIDSQKIPQHIAIIMDGNGRWAQKRGLPRSAGHKKGAQAVRRAVESAAKIGVEYLTLFGFSSENWSRPQDEINDLMNLLRHYLRSETAELHKKGVKLKVIGDRSAFDDDIVKLIENAESLTEENDKVKVVIALNYGGRNDIVQAAVRLHNAHLNEKLTIETAAAQLPGFLMTQSIPDPDLLIRTSGETRISNFLLWQCAYSELVFSDILWPDFNRKDLEAAIEEFAGRERRFGAVQTQKS